MRIAVFRTAHFNAAHRLSNDHWSLEKNLEVLEYVSIQDIMDTTMIWKLNSWVRRILKRVF